METSFVRLYIGCVKILNVIINIFWHRQDISYILWSKMVIVELYINIHIEDDISSLYRIGAYELLFFVINYM